MLCLRFATWWGSVSSRNRDVNGEAVGTSVWMGRRVGSDLDTNGIETDLCFMCPYILPARFTSSVRETNSPFLWVKITRSVRKSPPILFLVFTSKKYSCTLKHVVCYTRTFLWSRVVYVTSAPSLSCGNSERTSCQIGWLDALAIFAYALVERTWNGIVEMRSVPGILTVSFLVLFSPLGM